MGLELRLNRSETRFYDPVTNKTLFSFEEEASARQAAEAKAQLLAALP